MSGGKSWMIVSFLYGLFVGMCENISFRKKRNVPILSIYIGKCSEKNQKLWLERYWTRRVSISSDPLTLMWKNWWIKQHSAFISNLRKNTEVSSHSVSIDIPIYFYSFFRFGSVGLLLLLSHSLQFSIFFLSCSYSVHNEWLSSIEELEDWVSWGRGDWGEVHLFILYELKLSYSNEKSHCTVLKDNFLRENEWVEKPKCEGCMAKDKEVVIQRVMIEKNWSL